MTLWIAVAALIALTLAALLAALLRARPPAVSRADYDVVVYRSQLDEVERDLDRGILAPDLAEAARLEIKRRMLAAAGDAAAPPPGGSGAPAWRGATLALLVVLVPVASIGLYLGLGSPGMSDRPLAARTEATRTAAHEEAEMARLTARLAQQMERQPDRVDGWLLLGRSLRTLGQYDDAARAFERALALTGRAPDVLSEYGELLVLAHGGRVAEPARRAFDEVLRAAPDEPRAHYYLGLAKAQAGDARGALQAWVDLIAVSPPDAPWVADVRREIRGVAEAAGIDAGTLAPSPDLPGSAVTDLGEEDMRAAEGMSAEERDAMIRAMVEGLALRLEDEPDDADGWRRLARAYQVLGEPDKARDALRRAEAAEKKTNP